MGSRMSLTYFVIQRLDSLMAINESRHEAKQAIRDSSLEKRWTVSTGKIHSYTTRDVYQQQIMQYVRWAKETHHIRKPADLDTHADAWVSEYLEEGIKKGKSSSTLYTQRSALRLFFGPHVAASVQLPKRKRKEITRSRGPVAQDKHFQPKNWPDQVLVAKATGLRRSELRDLRVREVTTDEQGQLWVHVRNGKGGKARDVVVMERYKEDVLALIEGCDPDEHLFALIPKDMDVQSYRRASAQERYLQQAPERTLPSTTKKKRIHSKDYNAEAVQEVSESLGHSRRRRSIVLNHYLQ